MATQFCCIQNWALLAKLDGGLAPVAMSSLISPGGGSPASCHRLQRHQVVIIPLRVLRAFVVMSFIRDIRVSRLAGPVPKTLRLRLSAAVCG